MTIYTVLAPPDRADWAGPEPDRFVFVKEGFCWPAFYITTPWLIWHRMWLVLLAYLVVTAAVLTLASRVPSPVAWTVLVLFAVLVGLEANNLRRWTLERRGYRLVGIASGDRREEAEYRFFADRSSNAQPPAREDAPKPASAKPSLSTPAAAGEIVGLFPSAGGQP